jgi:hypothetical protein
MYCHRELLDVENTPGGPIDMGTLAVAEVEASHGICAPCYEEHHACDDEGDPESLISVYEDERSERMAEISGGCTWPGALASR